MRLVVALLSIVALAFAAPAAADAPTEFPILDVFEDVNPCTGNPMTVTFVGTTFIHEHGSRVLGRAERTITTSDGFVGRGTDSFVDNGQILVFRLTDILTLLFFEARFVLSMAMVASTSGSEPYCCRACRTAGVYRTIARITGAD